jgi:hypothetical protein
MKINKILYFSSFAFLIFVSLSIFGMEPQKTNIQKTTKEEANNLLTDAIRKNYIMDVFKAINEGADPNLMIDGISVLERLVLDFSGPRPDLLILAISELLRRGADVNPRRFGENRGLYSLLGLLDRLTFDPTYHHFISERAHYILPLLDAIQSESHCFLKLREAVDMTLASQLAAQAAEIERKRQKAEREKRMGQIISEEKIEAARRREEEARELLNKTEANRRKIGECKEKEAEKEYRNANTRLSNAIRTNSIPDVIQAIKDGADPNLMVDGISVLERLVIFNSGNVNQLKTAITLLLRRGADANPTRLNDNLRMFDRLSTVSAYRHYLIQRAPIIEHALNWVEGRLGHYYPGLRRTLAEAQPDAASRQSIFGRFS